MGAPAATTIAANTPATTMKGDNIGGAVAKETIDGGIAASPKQQPQQGGYGLGGGGGSSSSAGSVTGGFRRIFRRNSKSDLSKRSQSPQALRRSMHSDPKKENAAASAKRGLFRLPRRSSRGNSGSSAPHANANGAPSSNGDLKQTNNNNGATANLTSPRNSNNNNNNSNRRFGAASPTNRLKSPVATIVLNAPNSGNNNGIDGVVADGGRQQQRQQQQSHHPSRQVMSPIVVEPQRVTPQHQQQMNNPEYQQHQQRNSPLAVDETAKSGSAAVTMSRPDSSMFNWQDNLDERTRREMQQRKQFMKERDGFCRRVDVYDGQILTVEGQAAYELGNYLGGGVAGVVYEGHRLRPVEEYPVRLGRHDSLQSLVVKGDGLVISVDPTNWPYSRNQEQRSLHKQQQQQQRGANGAVPSQISVDNFRMCLAGACQVGGDVGDEDAAASAAAAAVADEDLEVSLRGGVNNHYNHNAVCGMDERVSSLLSEDQSLRTQRDNAAAAGGGGGNGNGLSNMVVLEESQIALETTASTSHKRVLIDTVDAPSRSKHYAKALLEMNKHKNGSNNGNSATNGYDNGQEVEPIDFPSDASFTTGGVGRMEETVAIKVLNPVGFRTLAPDVTNKCVVARVGEEASEEVLAGKLPMEERHVWWLVNPNSRNLRTLQRYTADDDKAASNSDNASKTNRRVEIDRGSPSKGLRISLLAAYKDADGIVRELPLTRCIEIWGHVPFGASDAEFASILTAIDKINQGLPPPPLPAFGGGFSAATNAYMGATPGGHMYAYGNSATPLAMMAPAAERVGTGGTNTTSSLSGGSTSIEDASLNKNSNQLHGAPHPMNRSKRTGIYRAASTERKTVFCDELKAYIALPAVPSKYLKWLRQRRAATKEIRNMMLIGRHRNVVHLFEVLEFIQETKSTMFLILELVRGGELFDLISSNTARISSTDKIPQGFTESETVMRKFFRELASGVYYCHSNGIAHRDLKPENLLVHNSRNGECTLKIADFGLSAAFGPNSQSQTDTDTVVESLAPNSSISQKYESDASLISNFPQQQKQQQQQQSQHTSSGPLSPSMKEKMDKLFVAGGNALSFLTCGAMEEFITASCLPKEADYMDGTVAPQPLKRMTSVVGSPHYVAPEIISQNETTPSKCGKSGQYEIAPQVGYDGTKADVWSAGVILYAMLFRSLPFGEDLLRCPRYQSFKKWYDEVKMVPDGRRTDVSAPLNPIITEQEERDFLGPHWFFPSHSSPESRDLIVYMLNPDPDARPTIRMVLQHPWLLKQ